MDSSQKGLTAYSLRFYRRAVVVHAVSPILIWPLSCILLTLSIREPTTSAEVETATRRRLEMQGVEQLVVLLVSIELPSD